MDVEVKGKLNKQFFLCKLVILSHVVISTIGLCYKLGVKTSILVLFVEGMSVNDACMNKFWFGSRVE